MSAESKPLAICVMGPTASGKTDLALELIEEFPCEIISVDSGQVYRGMDIGTAKPDSEVLARAPHRLIDIRDPDQAYSAGEFRRDALREMAEIERQGRIPLLVGGTMLYFKALAQGMADLPQADVELRERLEALGAEKGWNVLHQRLSEIDPEAAAQVHPNNPQRLVRALEVYELTGKPISQHWREQKNKSANQERLPFRLVNISIVPTDRTALHQRIETRFQQMVARGFVEEVQQLKLDPKLHRDLPAMRAVGYRQVWDYLDGQTNYAEMVQRGVIATRQLAKRQLTWLRGWPDASPLDALGSNLLGQALKILHCTAK